ncbi:hypothetical protein NQ176_g5696 [Zarea fungicola]|uniref:Uncharacterized protein n=1 Tax=Zarea fungicola TaxID=93591 RepID=A0ACC1N7R8_9HYPO|nr:hypothetical protein NQ176_g5696 [Lecanicillium fungicola]
MADAAAAAATPRKRSRAGCYTCKTRKVRCERPPQAVGNDNHPETQCVNCRRLGFHCRWQAPAAGEEYIPPPKRRRAIARRHGETGENGRDEAQAQSALERHDLQDSAVSTSEPHDVQESVVSPALLSDLAASAPTQLPGEVLDLFSGFFLDSDFGSVSGSFDLSSAGEGLDFVPLPSLDTAMLQDLNMPTPFSDWPTPSPLSGEALSGKTSINSNNSSNNNNGGSSRGDMVDLHSPHTSVNPNNRRLIQHYLDVMKGYAKVDDHSKDDNNLFISAFTKSLYFPPLFHAILAFSASHLAMEDPSYAQQARALVVLAGESFDTFRHAETLEVDGLLSALFVRVKTVHMVAGSVDTFLSLIAAAADIVSIKREELTLDTRPSLTRRIIVRLAILDARATYHRIGRGQLVHLIEEIPAFSSLFARDFTASASRGALFNLLRADILRMRVAELDARLHAQMENEFVTDTPIRTSEVMGLYDDIEHEIHQWNQQMAQQMDISTPAVPAEETVLSSVAFGYNIVFSALHSALVYLYSVYASIMLPLPSSGTLANKT